MSLPERMSKQSSPLAPAGERLSARCEAIRAVGEFQSKLQTLPPEQLQDAYARLIVRRGFKNPVVSGNEQPSPPAITSAVTEAKAPPPAPVESPAPISNPNPTNHMKNKPILQALERHLSVVSLLLIAGVGLIVLQGPVGHTYSVKSPLSAFKAVVPAAEASPSTPVVAEIASNNDSAKSDSSGSPK